jgi:hypothetical protein
MSRDGLARADTDTSLLSDPKVNALARRLRDPIRTGAALTLYEAVRLSSWREGERMALSDCLPAWWIGSDDDIAALAFELVAVRLLDDELRIPEHAWTAWYEPARERLDDSNRRRVFGGLIRSGLSKDEANKEADRRLNKLKAEPKAGLLKAEPKAGPALRHLPSIHPSIQPPIQVAEEDEIAAPAARVHEDASGARPKEGDAKAALLANGLDVDRLDVPRRKWPQ